MPRQLNPLTLPPGLHRRHFLAAGATLGAWSLWTRETHGITRAAINLPDHPFQLGIASGDPAPDGMVLWTRLAPRPLEADGGMPTENVEVKWRVASDERMTKIVREGIEVAKPEEAHSVHAEVTGLEPDRWYFYQFEAAGQASAVGRTRTLPKLDSQPERLKFAMVSCQHYETGYYPTYEVMAGEGHDLVFHLGDYMYEYGGADKKLRRHVGLECKSLDQYRARHAQYKTDADLQAMHAVCPWIVTWDDHEFDNNCAGSTSEEVKVQAEEFLLRRAAAYKAYYEHMPLRRSCLPKGPDAQLYRTSKYGRLAEFFVLDTRQYRSDQPCGDGNKPQCEEALSEKQTLLGEAQEAWLQKQMAASQGTWNVLAQQVMMARVDRKVGKDVGYSMDQWPGYEANRRRVLQYFEKQKVANPVVLGGDIHTNWANDLIIDFDKGGTRTVATEFVCTSLSSGGNGVDKPKDHPAVISENPFVKLWNAERGYVICEVTPKKWVSHFRVAADVTKRHTPIRTRASFVVEAGKPGAELA